MKKQMMILTVLMGICLTGCGPTAMSGSDSATTVPVTESTSASVADTTQTETSVVDILTTTTMDDAGKTTNVSVTECQYSVADVVGEWSAPDTVGMTNTTMTIQADGTFYVRYALGGTRIGKVSVEPVDGINYYSFCADSDTPWMRYACGNQPVNQLKTEQADGINFVRISIEDVAISKMNNMTYIMAALSGARNPQADEKDALIIGEDRYELLDDEKLRAIDSNSKIAFEKLLEQTTSDALKTQWQGIFEECLLEQDGNTYIRTSRPHGYHIFETNGGVSITNQTEKSFTATTKDSNQMEGCGSAQFVFDGTDWKMVSFAFQ